VKNLSIYTRPSFTFARLVKTSNREGFTQRLELYNKHMLSSSSLIRKKRYWSEMMGKNRKKPRKLYGRNSLLNMTLSLHHRDYVGWVIQLDGYHTVGLSYHPFLCFGSMLPIHFSLTHMFMRSHSVMKPTQEKIDQCIRSQPLRGGNLLYIT